MREDLAELIATRPFYHEGLRDIAALLPDDAELHKWLMEAAAEFKMDDLIFLICAAAMDGRELDASILTTGLALFPDDWRFAWIAWRMKGDVTSALLAASDAGVPTSRSAMALFIATAWWQKHRPGVELPRKIASSAHVLSGYKGLNAETVALLGAYSALANGELMARVSPGAKGSTARRLAKAEVERIFKVLREPFAKLIPEKKTHDFGGHRTLRRAVPRIGRNEKCPCGSGKKYKHCCYEKDQERLRHSSEVAGKTQEELEMDPNVDLTRQRLGRMMPAEIEKLDPLRVPVELRQEFVLRLGVFERFEALVSAFEKLGVPEPLQKTWSHAFHYAISSWRRDIVVRLLAVWPDAEATLGDRHPAVDLILASDDPANLLKTLETESLKALRSNETRDVECVASGLLSSPYKALAILLARSALPILEWKLAARLFEAILSVRGELDLPPDDEFSDLMEERARRERKGDPSAPLMEAQEKLERKAEEVRQVREKLAALERELTLREKREQRAAAPANSAAPETEALRDLRGKVGQLKSLLKERGEERATLRRELEKLHEHVEILKSEKEANGTDASLPEMEEAGEPLEVSGQQPVRLIAFPKKFLETLAAFPQPVGRTAMQRLGRIASGEPTAFMDLVKIYDGEDLLRLRVAGDYRLLLQLFPERVQVVDVVNRKDLQRRLRTLRTSGVASHTR